MKKIFYLCLFMGAIIMTVVGQSLRKTERIEADQVPVAIQQSLKVDFGSIPPDGYWTATFIIEQTGSRAAAKPLFYTYHKKDSSQKIEVRYTADGKLDSVKGLDKQKSDNS